MTHAPTVRTLPSVPTTPPTTSATYLNRDLSWISFNERVLEEALDTENPLLERLRFLTIYYTNLDEFFMIRVSGLKQQLAAGIDVLSADGLSPRAQLNQIHERLRPLTLVAQSCLENEVLPQLAQAGVEIVHYRDLPEEERRSWDRWYLDHVHPILTPLAVGPTVPFPFISNLSLNLAMVVESPKGEQRLARVKCPLGNLSRLIPLRDPAQVTTNPSSTLFAPPVRLLPLEELIAANLATLFPGMVVHAPYLFRVTRDADLEIKVDEADDLLSTLQQELRRRRFGHAVRLEVEAGMPPDLREVLRANLDLDPNDVDEVPGLMAVPRLQSLLSIDLPEHRYPPFIPARPKALRNHDLFSRIRAGDVMLHHPFDSFTPVLEFIRHAAHDPQVVAIKQTLYRTSGNSPVIQALEEAVELGKQVAVVVELKARFDEENNIVWARRLEEHGVHVIYGVPGLKTHSKLALIIRREDDQLRRYAHIGTGNYNPTTARVYTDLGLLTADPGLTADVADLFNQLTGFALPAGFRDLLVAPRFMKRQLIQRIRAEADEAARGRPARIIAKCNAVTDPEIIQELYAASQAGVRIDLLVRGICCLVPGVPGLSDQIEVRSVVGRFLEHSRVYWFQNGGEPLVYIGSADWMERNLDRRVEVLTPIRDPELGARLRAVLLQRYLDDRGRTRRMMPDGRYERLRETLGSEEPDVHRQFLEDVAKP